MINPATVKASTILAPWERRCFFLLFLVPVSSTDFCGYASPSDFKCFYVISSADTLPPPLPLTPPVCFMSGSLCHHIRSTEPFSVNFPPQSVCFNHTHAILSVLSIISTGPGSGQEICWTQHCYSSATLIRFLRSL